MPAWESSINDLINGKKVKAKFLLSQYMIMNNIKTEKGSNSENNSWPNKNYFLGGGSKGNRSSGNKEPASIQEI